MTLKKMTLLKSNDHQCSGTCFVLVALSDLEGWELFQDLFDGVPDAVLPEQPVLFYAPPRNESEPTEIPAQWCSLAQAIRQEGYKFQVKSAIIVWSEEHGALLQGNLSEKQKIEYLYILKQVWVMNRVAQWMNRNLDGVTQAVKQIMRFEKVISPASLKYLPVISEKLHLLRQMDLIITSPYLNGSALMAKGPAFRILFNEICDEELEIADYYDTVWERVEQLLDYYEAWQEKLVEYRSFFYEAILEIAIIIFLVISIIQQFQLR